MVPSVNAHTPYHMHHISQLYLSSEYLTGANLLTHFSLIPQDVVVEKIVRLAHKLHELVYVAARCWSVSFLAAAFSLVVLKTQMLFIASGKPSGAVVLSVVVVGILIPDRSLSSAVVLFSVRRHRLCHSNAFCITLISIYGMHNAVQHLDNSTICLQGSKFSVDFLLALLTISLISKT